MNYDYCHDLRNLQQFMPEADEKEKVIVKVLVKAEFVSSLYEALPDMKLLLVVKNPITRIVSHIVHEFVNPGGLFQGTTMPLIDDIIMGRVQLSVPEIGEPQFFSHLRFIFF